MGQLRIIPVLLNDRGCWLWQGARSHGYARVTIDKRNHMLHRLFYEQLVGAIPRGHQVHHECENKNCLNPDHFRLLSHSEHTVLHNRPHDTCRRGHDLTDPANARFSRTGERRCRICNSMASLALYHRKRLADPS